MLTSRNDDLRWILATIVESGNRQFWGWLRDVFFASIFLAYASIFLAYVEPNLFFRFQAGKFSSAAPTEAYLNETPEDLFLD